MNKQTFEYWYENKFSLKQKTASPSLKELLKDTWEEAYFIGRDEGYGDGRDEGYEDGYDEGKSEGVSEGYDSGYADGYADGENSTKKEYL
jgi:flagellar biosynthesis/type III secretory pathway protein FliH